MMCIVNNLFVIYLLIVINAAQIEDKTQTYQDNKIVTPHPSRRILRGRAVGETRPYMVYLRGAPNADSKITETNWLCGGVIIHKLYILTSAACIEDAKHFYVISGTHTWAPSNETHNECITNGAKKAIWKCVPKAYYFDGNEFDNIRWMVGDIAVVKVEGDFNFERRVKGCDYIPKKVSFNNYSLELEKSGTVASTAGWGATEIFGDVIGKPADNSPDLLETDVVLISKNSCKKHWEERYHFIIEDHMICSKDVAEDEAMSTACAEHDVDCKELGYSDEDEEDEGRRRMIRVPKNLTVDHATHFDFRRNQRKVPSGGFCENDHGGPLIAGQGRSSVVVGIMSACLTKEITHKCHGPFLYTSVYKHRNLISCAIDKEHASAIAGAPLFTILDDKCFVEMFNLINVVRLAKCCSGHRQLHSTGAIVPGFQSLWYVKKGENNPRRRKQLLKRSRYEPTFELDSRELS